MPNDEQTIRIDQLPDWSPNYVSGPLDGNAIWEDLVGVMRLADEPSLESFRDAPPKEEATPPYEEDFYAWTQDQAVCLRHMTAAEADDLGLDNAFLAEEIEDLGKSELRGLKSQIQRAAMHLLKWKYQKNARHNGWKSTIIEARFQIESYFESASLRKKITDAEMEDLFRKARQLAIAETGLANSNIPEGTVFSLKEIEDHDFFPEPD